MSSMLTVAEVLELEGGRCLEAAQKLDAENAAQNVPKTRYTLRVPLSSTGSVSAGKQITRGEHTQYLAITGTASLIVRKKGTSTGAYVLTAMHVLGSVSINAPATGDNLFYSPNYSSVAGIQCNHAFGEVVTETLMPLGSSPRDQKIHALYRVQPGDKETFAVDAGLIKLDSDADASNDMPQIGQISGVRDLISEWSLRDIEGSTVLDAENAKIKNLNVQVKKFGGTTKYTEGTIVGLIRMQVVDKDSAETANALVFEVAVKPGNNNFSEEYPLDMEKFESNDEITTVAEVKARFDNTNVTATIGGSTEIPTLKLEANTFSQPGDSGAPIIDANNKIVGIIASGDAKEIYVKGKDLPIRIKTGNTQVIFITAALERWQVEFLPSGQQTAGTRVIVPGMPIQHTATQATDWVVLDDFFSDVEKSPMGARIAAVVRRHLSEVRDLIHHRRRVMVTWHRNKGPAFVAAFIRAMGQPERLLPSEIDGVRLIDTLQAMCAVFVAEGSPELRAVIVEHEQTMLAHIAQVASVDDILTMLTNAEQSNA